MDVEKIAKICHNVNRAYCMVLDDTSQFEWDNAEKWQQESAILGVKFHIDNPDADPSHSHTAWLKEKIKKGWRWGPEKNTILKLHPCLVPYNKLSSEQQAKDFIFTEIVNQLKDME